APDIFLNDLERVELSFSRPPTWVANHARSAADEHNGPVASSLQMSQTHDGNQIADAEASCRGVEPAVGDDRPCGEHLAHAFGVLKEQPAPRELIEIGSYGHSSKILGLAGRSQSRLCSRFPLPVVASPLDEKAFSPSPVHRAEPKTGSLRSPLA